MNKTVSLKLVIIALISGIAVFIQVLPTFSENYHFSNDWLKKSNIYVFWNPPLDYLETVNATGTTWSVYYSGLNSYDLAYVDELHSNGFKVGSNFPTVQGNITNDQSLLESAHCIDLNGNPSTFFGGQYAMCYNNPTWQEFLKNRIKEHVDGKADAIHIDEIGSIGLDSGGGFCDYCMAAFNSYLSSHYSAEDLQQLFGIENINLFNYRTYLLGKGAQSVWDDPNPNLITEYLKSQYLSKAMKIQELIRYAQNYAGRAILFSGNPYGFRSNQQASIPYLDFVIFEMPIGSLPGGKHFTTYLLGEAMAPSKPFVGFPDIFDLASLSQDDWWLWRHWVAEAFACGASFLLPYRAYTYGGGEYTLFAEKIAPYTNFISTHSSYFKNVSRIAKVAVLHDLGSTLSNQVFWHAQFAWEDFLKTGLTLQEAHIPFEIIYKGDAEFVNKPITLSDLEKYSVVIVPSYYQLDNATENLLNQYLSEGGYVVRAENIPQGSNLIEEVRKTGANLGLETDASKDLSIIVYKKGDSLLLHLINYNYNYSTHDFIPQNQIKIAATIPDNVDLTGKSLKLLSPDTAQQTILDYTIQGDKVTFTIPNVHEYLIASFSPLLNTFSDVPWGYWAYDYIIAIYNDGITQGCAQDDPNTPENERKYCPEDNVTRGQMAAFIIRAKYGENFSYTTTPYFTDVPSTHTFFKYVQKLRDDGITVANGTYGVDSDVTRGQVSAFIIRAKYGENFSYTSMPYFTDVPTTHTFFKYVQKLKDEGITALTGIYGVDDNVTRAQMAAFLARAFLGME